MYIASLPWYDFPEIRFATDLLWSRLADNLRRIGLSNVPDRLDRETCYHRQWSSGQLLLSQACGYDVLLSNSEYLKIVATPVYNAPGCQGAHYSSFAVVHQDSSADHLADLRGTRCVINELTSHSGMNALRAMVAPMNRGGRFFSEILISGSHERSIKAVAERRAEVATIDCITYELLKRHRPHLLKCIRVLCCSSHMPAPPYVASSRMREQDVNKIRIAFQKTLQEPDLKMARESLLLDDIEQVSLGNYREIADWEAEAYSVGYTEMNTGTSIRSISQDGGLGDT